MISLHQTCCQAFVHVNLHICQDIMIANQAVTLLQVMNIQSCLVKSLHNCKHTFAQYITPSKGWIQYIQEDVDRIVEEVFEPRSQPASLPRLWTKIHFLLNVFFSLRKTERNKR